MEHKNDLLLAASMFLTWLTAITTNQIIGGLTVIVLALTAYNRYLTTKREKAATIRETLEQEKIRLEIKLLEKQNGKYN